MKEFSQRALNFFSNTDKTFNAKNITDYENKQLKTSYPTQFKQNFMKINLKFLYNKFKPHPKISI